MKFILTLSLLIFSFLSSAQRINILTGKTGVSLRGLSVVNDTVLWASGSKGTVVRSLDGGRTFDWMTVTGYESRDFRDVEAFDNNIAIIMAVDEPAVILKTVNGGKSWKKVFEDSTKGMFLDAMDFNGKYGIVVGDPINGKMYEARTFDSAETWSVNKQTSDMIADEAFFASSGTNVKEVYSRHGHPFTYYVSGGMQSRFFGYADTVLPLVKGTNTTGANSLDCFDESYCVVVGGDFKNDKDTTGNCILLHADIKNSNKVIAVFTHPQTPPHGYRSCVAFITGNKLITCGTSGVDISNDGGENWRLISNESFHACGKAKRGTAVYLAGKDGRIGKMVQ